MDEKRLRHCPLCGHDKATQLPNYSKDGWINVRCQRCSLVYLGNPPDYTLLEEEYAWEKTSREKKKENRKGSTFLSPAARKARNLLRPFRGNDDFFHRLFGNGAVLDIGCGPGHRLKPPITPFGIELSVELHALADRRMRDAGGYCLHGAGAERIWDFPESHFDGILMHSYLEHEKDIVNVMQGANRALKPGGHVYVRVPNFGSINRRVLGRRWCGFRFPDHVNYFDRHTLKRLAGQTEFDFSLTNFIRLPFDDNLLVVLKKSEDVEDRL
ncbi:MAG: class I SAM-dependent methyltransferase [Silicimonas sp.]